MPSPNVSSRLTANLTINNILIDTEALSQRCSSKIVITIIIVVKYQKYWKTDLSGTVNKEK